MISVIIPTYKEPEVLDICLKSAIEGQGHKNEIIVVVDGFYDLNKNVLEKYKNNISILNLPDNMGLIRATNLGVYNSSFNRILIVNDDNVFPKNWDEKLLEVNLNNSVVSPNQIEPTPSMFSQFHIHNLGRDPQNFNLEGFWEYERKLSVKGTEKSGSTLPIYMNKKDYLKVGGWDESYPGAWVVDWDFFLKCELAGMKMIRTYNCHFYHFVSIGTESSPEEQQRKSIREKECHEYFKYKWGEYAQHNPKNNSKLINRYA